MFLIIWVEAVRHGASEDEGGVVAVGDEVVVFLREDAGTGGVYGGLALPQGYHGI